MHTHKEKEFPKVFSLIKKSLETYKSNYKTILGMALIPLVLSIVSVLLEIVIRLIKGTNIGIELLVVAVALIVILLASIFQLSMQIGVFSFLKSKTGDVKDLMKGGLKLFLPAVFITILVGVIILGGIPFLFIPAFVASFIFSFSIISLAQDDKRGLSALAHSYYVTEGRVSRVILNYLSFGIIVVLFSLLTMFFGLGIFIMPNGQIMSVFLLMIVQHLIIMPVSLIYAHHLMTYLRGTKEAFLPEMEIIYSKKIKNYFIIGLCMLPLSIYTIVRIKFALDYILINEPNGLLSSILVILLK